MDAYGILFSTKTGTSTVTYMAAMTVLSAPPFFDDQDPDPDKEQERCFS